MSTSSQTYSVYELMIDVPNFGLVSTRMRVFDEKSMHAMHTAIDARLYGRLHKSRYSLSLIKQAEDATSAPFAFPFFVRGARRGIMWRNPILDALYIPIDDTGYSRRKIRRLWIDIGDYTLLDYCPLPIWQVVESVARDRDPHFTTIKLVVEQEVAQVDLRLVSKRSRPFDGTHSIDTSFLNFEGGLVSVIEGE